MCNEPLRRVLFPTPPKNDDGISTRSIQRIRPKAEISPVNLESTPTFKQLVESSPIPLAVAAATAAMRAAKSAQTGTPIITDMTRAAEEVVKNSEYNSIRPPFPSPRALSSPQFSVVRAAPSASTSLPPTLSPARRPTVLKNTFRSIFMPQRTFSRSSVPPVDNAAHYFSDTRGVNENNAKFPLTHTPSRATGKRITSASSRTPTSIPPTLEKVRKKQVVIPGKQPFPRAKSDPLSRVFGAISPVPIEHVVESPIGGRESLDVANGGLLTSPRRAEPIKERRKKRSHKSSEQAQEAYTPENKENVTSRMQTRSLKKARPRFNPAVAGGSQSKQPKKKRRLSEVFRLQKALETAAWTNSRAVEKQTEVIVISDNSPIRPRVDVTIKPQNKPPRESDAVRKVVPTNGRGTKAIQQSQTVEKKLTSKKKARGKSGPVKPRASKDENQKASRNRHGEGKVTQVKRKRSSLTGVSLERVGESTGATSNGPPEAPVRKKRTGKQIHQEQKRLDHVGKAVGLNKRKTRDTKTLEDANANPAKVSTRIVAESHVPLKKRIAEGQRNQNSLSEQKIADTPHSFGDTQHEKKSRKMSHPKRLSHPVSEDVGVLQTSKGNPTATKQQKSGKEKADCMI